MTTTTKHTVHGVNFWISADFAQASSPIYVNFHGEEAESPDWQLTPFQVADAQHDQGCAAEMVADWGELTPSYSQIEASLVRLGATADEADAMTDILHTEGWGGDEDDITDEVLTKKLAWYRECRAEKWVECQCGRITGEQCSWSGPVSETVTVEYMPNDLRGDHEAAGNIGTYPANGAERFRVERTCAERLMPLEGEWMRIVGGAA